MIRNKSTVQKVVKSEFWLNNGYHVIFDMISHYVTMYCHEHESRTIKTRRLPTIVNAVWIAKNYPLKKFKL